MAQFATSSGLPNLFKGMLSINLSLFKPFNIGVSIKPGTNKLTLIFLFINSLDNDLVRPINADLLDE